MVKKIKYLTLVLVGLMFILLGQPVIAAEQVVTPQSYDYIANTTADIDSYDSNVTVTGITQTSSAVDKIVTTVYLEKQTSSGDWTTVDSWTKTVYCKASGTKSVSSGYYRARCNHKAYEGNLVETNYSQTTQYKV